MDIVSASDFQRLIDFAITAHDQHIQPGAHATRQEGRVPYSTHVVWCAMLLLNDVSIPWRERYIGYQALLLHDVLEDTTAELPPDLDREVVNLVRDMTYSSWQEEVREVPKKSDLVKLLKLIDKTASIYDGRDYFSPKRKKEWRAFTELLLQHVEPVYGSSQVVAVSRAIVHASGW